MLVTFSSPAHANITMFGDVAAQLLKMMGHTGTIPSAIVAKDIPVALAHLEAAIEATKQEHEPDVSEEDNQQASSVSIPHRALPLIEMLNAAIEDDSNVMWEGNS